MMLDDIYGHLWLINNVKMHENNTEKYARGYIVVVQKHLVLFIGASAADTFRRTDAKTAFNLRKYAYKCILFVYLT